MPSSQPWDRELDRLVDVTMVLASYLIDCHARYVPCDHRPGGDRDCPACEGRVRFEESWPAETIRQLREQVVRVLPQIMSLLSEEEP